MKKVLVLGGAGFLGSHVADQLTESGFQVTIFDRRPSKFLKPDQVMIEGDVLDAGAVHAAVKGHDVVYHFAGFADLNEALRHPYEALNSNVLGTTNVAMAASACKVERLVLASTVYVFSIHGSFYGISKRCAEQVVEEFSRQQNLKYTILRYGSVYGVRSDRSNRIHRIVEQALKEKKITFQGNGEEEREYIHVRDAAKLSLQILAPEFQNKNVILTGVERFRYSDLLKMIQEMFNYDVKIEYLNQDYKGHYNYTPYSFNPASSMKLVANPFTDFGQGLLETIMEIDHNRQKELSLN